MTILLASSSMEVIRNFFFFPHSLFDRLQKDIAADESLKVVIVARPQDKERIAVFIDDAARKGITIEIVDGIGRQQGMIAKAISFFYSYLVYTGTTKTLATVGMRPNDAPGAARRSLAFLKLFISRTFGASNAFKRAVAPMLYCASVSKSPFDYVFKQYNPDVVFVPNLFDPFDMRVLEAARRFNCRTIGMVASWDHLDKYYLPLHVDTLLVQSNQLREFAVKLQAYEERDVKIVGYPYFDFIVDEHFISSRGEVTGALGFPDGVPYIVYISGSMYCPDEPDIIETILAWISEGVLPKETHLVIRPYPGGRGKDIDFDQQKFEGFKDRGNVFFYMGKFWGDVEKSARFVNMIRHASAVIAVYSTAGLEALGLDRPVITPSFDGNKVRPFHRSVKRFEMREHFRDLLNSPGMKKADSFADLRMYLTEAVHDPSRGHDDREALRRQVTGPVDGRVTSRIYQVIKNA